MLTVVNHHVSKTVEVISVKFGMLMHIGPTNTKLDKKNSKFQRVNIANDRYYENYRRTIPQNR